MLKIHKNICSLENQANYKLFALFKKSGGFEKYWRFYKNQADLRNIGAFKKVRRIWKILVLSRKTGGFGKYWRFPEKQADLENIGALQKNRRTIESLQTLKSPRLVKIRRVPKSRRPYCLGSAESPAADFLLDWLKSSRSEPRRYVASLLCRPQVRDGLPACCFYLRTLSRTVPAACTGPRIFADL